MTHIVPPILVAGDSWTTTYTPTDSAYAPQQGWTFTISLRGPTQHDFVATNNGATYSVNVLSTSATYVEGIYKYICTLSKTNQRVTVETGQITISPDLSTLPIDFDARTHEQKMLALIEAHLEKRAVGQIDHVLTTIDGKTLQRMNTNELLDLRNRYKSLVQRQMRGNFPKKVVYDFRGSGI